MFSDLPKPTIFAHRGSSAYAPENTLAAFELAVRQDADAIEFDVKLSADGHAVVIHDQTVDRTTDGHGKVSELQLEDLKSLDAGSKFDVAFAEEKIPTLEEVFESVLGKIFINIELTNYASPWDDLPQKVAQIVSAFTAEEQVLFSSFNPIALRRIHKLIPAAPLGLLAFPGFAGAWARSRLGRWVPYQALHTEAADVTTDLIQKQHHHGWKVNTYTVNHAEEMLNLFQMEIDGIFTDDPPLAQTTRAQFSAINKSTS
jgi:glycerophosphoryl diester phosphodiesterase